MDTQISLQQLKKRTKVTSKVHASLWTYENRNLGPYPSPTGSTWIRQMTNRGSRVAHYRHRGARKTSGAVAVNQYSEPFNQKTFASDSKSCCTHRRLKSTAVKLRLVILSCNMNRLTKFPLFHAAIHKVHIVNHCSSGRQEQSSRIETAEAILCGYCFFRFSALFIFYQSKKSAVMVSKIKARAVWRAIWTKELRTVSFNKLRVAFLKYEEFVVKFLNYFNYISTNWSGLPFSLAKTTVGSDTMVKSDNIVKF